MMTVHDHVRLEGLHTEILRRARRAGLAGATLFEACEGYGLSGRIHRSHLLTDDAPLALVIVDAPDRIDAFIGQLGPLLDGVVATIDDIEIVDLTTATEGNE
jgi:PII-like signaling protein